MTFYFEKVGKKTSFNEYNTIFIKGHINNYPSFNICFPFYFNKDNIDTIIEEFTKELNIKKIYDFNKFKWYLTIFTKKSRFHSIEFL